MGTHGSVLFADGFETYMLIGQLTGTGNYNNYYQGSNLALDSSVFFSGTKAIRYRMPTTGSEVSNAIEKSLPGQDTLFMRVYERFQPNLAGNPGRPQRH